MIGKPFKYKGRGPSHYDCIGVAIEVYKRIGVKLPEVDSTESYEKQHIMFMAGLSELMVKVDEPKPYDFLMFQVMPMFITHCGVYIDYGKFIHVESKVNVSIEDIKSSVWHHRLRGIYRHKDMI